MKGRLNELEPDREIFYVYEHIDPETEELVYLGHGSKGRAWVCGNGCNISRSAEHTAWTEELLDRGFIPVDWVNIVARNLSKRDAADLERGLIHEKRPKFNAVQGVKTLKFTPDVYRIAKALRENGSSYSQIAEHVGLSVMVVHRGLNGQSQALERLLEQERN